ncbi:RHS repeat-associated core domain-containing protein [Dysgonomonas reticulitermitis]
MATDSHKGILGIKYNSLNLPQELLIKNTEVSGKVYYTYSASGVKLKTEQRYDPTLSVAPMGATTPANDGFTDYKNTDYVGNIIYETEKKGTAITNKTKILVDGGYIEGGVYHYYLNDHLGNNRVVANASGTVIQKNHYYPFGTAFAEGTTAEQGKQPYKYNGKELDQMHGLNLYDYSARYYESAIGRFTTVDPLAEKYYSISPYVYVANNPLKYIDPTGMAPDTARVYTETIEGGHAWMSVGEGDDLVVYSYGPYQPSQRVGRSSGHAITGKGHLTKYTGTAAQKYLEKKKQSTDMTSVNITDVSENAIITVIEDIIKKGELKKSLSYPTFTETIINEKKELVVTGNIETYDVGDSYGSYNLFTNNCATFVSDVLNKSGSNTLNVKRTVIDRKHGEIYSVPSNQRYRHFVPSFLRSTLTK